MKIRHMLALSCLITLGADAAPEDMDIHVWDPGCNHTTATNWFELDPQQSSQQIYVDLSDCTDEQLGSLLFFGNYATRNSGRQLTARHKVRLFMTALDRYGNIAGQMSSDSGSILVDVAGADSRGCWLIAENMNRNKTVKIRLRAQLIAH